MSKNKPEQALVKIILTALFAAICFVAISSFQIPLPSPVGKPFLHLGNLFVILAALLFSGPVGGIAGALGMGLFDLTHGYTIYAPSTIILKLGMGLIVGYVALKGKKENAKSPAKWILFSSVLLLAAGIGLMWISFVKGNEIHIKGIEGSLQIIPVLYIFSMILGALLLVAAIFANKFSVKLQYAVIAAVSAIALNLFGELFFGALMMLLSGSAFVPALIGSAISLPATLINGTFSIVGAVVLYIPLEK
ncbi:MAG: ECF transporter S component, partial [Eubacteriales bacterium]